MKTCRPIFCAVSLAAVLALSACGNNDSNPNTTPAPGTTPVAQMSAPTGDHSMSSGKAMRGDSLNRHGSLPAQAGSLMPPPISSSSTMLPASAGTSGR